MQCRLEWTKNSNKRFSWIFFQWRFTEFSKYLRKFPDLCKKIKDTNDATILVPTNDAFLSLPPGELQKRMTDDGGRIVGLHFLDHPPGILADDVRVTKPQSDSGVSNKRFYVKHHFSIHITEFLFRFSVLLQVFHITQKTRFGFGPEKETCTSMEGELMSRWWRQTLELLMVLFTLSTRWKQHIKCCMINTNRL